MEPLNPEEAKEFHEKQIQNCCDELLGVFHDMKGALYFGLGGHATERLIQWTLDRYPLSVRLEALNRVQNELQMKMLELKAPELGIHIEEKEK